MALVKWFRNGYRYGGVEVRYRLDVKVIDKNGKTVKECVDCGQLTLDEILGMWVNLINNNLTASGVSNVQIKLNSSTGANIAQSYTVSVNSNTTNLSGVVTSGFSIQIAITISSACGTSCTVDVLNISWNWGSSSYGFQIYLNPSTNPCSLTAYAGATIVFTLNGSAQVTSGNASASSFVEWWSEIWAEIINGLMGSSSPFYGKTFNWAGSGSALNYYTVTLYDANGANIGTYNSSSSSQTNITSVQMTASQSSSQSTLNGQATWTISATFNTLPSTSDTLYGIDIKLYLNGSTNSSGATQLALGGYVETYAINVNQTVNQGSSYTIIVNESVTEPINT